MSQLNPPKVSVILPVYNGEPFLSEAIESILCQSFIDLELIVVNDGSTDSTATIIETKKDDRIVFINNKVNLGLVQSLNIAIKLSRGQYIARMDADDLSHRERLAQQLSFLEINNDVDVVGTAMYQMDASGHPFQLLMPPTEHLLIAWKMIFECPIFHPTVFMRRKALEEAGGYNPDFCHVEDIELWTRMLETATFANLATPLYSRRWHKNSICNTFRDFQRERTVEIKGRYAEQYLGVKLERNDYEMIAIGHVESPATYSSEMIKSAIMKLLELYTGYITRLNPPGVIREQVDKDIYERISFLKSREAVNNILYLKSNFISVTKHILMYVAQDILKSMLKRPKG